MLKVVYAVVEMLHSVTWFRTVATALPHENKCVKSRVKNRAKYKNWECKRIDRKTW